MSQTYTTSAGDTADFIAWKQYGSVTPDILNAVLAANPGLADYGPLLPAGVAVVLPVINTQTQAAAVQEVTLWN